MTLSDQLLTALVSTFGSGLSQEEVANLVVRYEAETGDTSLCGVTPDELMLLLLLLPHQRPGSRLGSSSMSGSWSGSWSWSGSRSWSRSRSRSRSWSRSWSRSGSGPE